jgi:hypothetical protein
MIYAIFVHILRWNLPESEPVMYDARDFHAVISGPHSPFRNRYTIYAKIHNHLRCFGSCFTLKSVRVRTQSRWDARDFYVVIFGTHSPFQNRYTIYAKIRNHLHCFGSCFTLKYVRVRTRSRWDARDFYAVIFGPHSPFRNRSTIYAKILNHLRCFGSCFTLKYVRVRTRSRWDAWDFYAVIFGPHSPFRNRSTRGVSRELFEKIQETSSFWRVRLNTSLHTYSLNCIYDPGAQDCIMQFLNCLLYLENWSRILGLYMP